MKMEKNIDVRLYKALSRLAFVSGSAVFMFFLTFHTDFPPEFPYMIYGVAGLSSFILGQAVKESIGIVCYQIAAQSIERKTLEAGTEE